MSLKGKYVWWYDNSTGKHFVGLAAFIQHAEYISGHPGKKANFSSFPSFDVFRSL